MREFPGGDFHLRASMIDRKGLHKSISSGHALIHNAYKKPHRVGDQKCNENFIVISPGLW